MSEARKTAAILVADIVGYSRLAGVDEDRRLSRLRGLRSDLIGPVITPHHGRIVKRTGDGGVIDFRSVVDAAQCARRAFLRKADGRASVQRARAGPRNLAGPPHVGGRRKLLPCSSSTWAASGAPVTRGTFKPPGG
jgi:class 3 adenylate cyclase